MISSDGAASATHYYCEGDHGNATHCDISIPKHMVKLLHESLLNSSSAPSQGFCNSWCIPIFDATKITWLGL